ncbi:hypothetical protein OXB_2996 [Bacillus sp. OxB-1]|uniref:hypothetical protein n=1 Tax=Bacillus sp. (strain OxB-1) TaxID=98228 RepID=UPI000581D066|nr:hypothetical protein [Bacillus sp. OxB-1]BAQ11466.1 hypothetical protein OXB_2996 [Bacillus sp. OxB-1]
MESVKVFQLNEYDAVAAESLEQAKNYYRKETGLSDDDAFYDYEPTELPLDFEAWTDETRTSKETLRSVVKEHWKGKPFIALSSD